jgi:hypothetical protein
MYTHKARNQSLRRHSGLRLRCTHSVHAGTHWYTIKNLFKKSAVARLHLCAVAFCPKTLGHFSNFNAQPRKSPAISTVPLLFRFVPPKILNQSAPQSGLPACVAGSKNPSFQQLARSRMKGVGYEK